MSDLSKRRVYVMDCGGFVKIGVSANVEARKNQIPFKVYQYYCTGHIANAFEVEKILHKKFSSFKSESICGNEYFNIGFESAINALKEITDEKFAKKMEGKRRIELLKSLNDCLQKLSTEQLSYIAGFSRGMALANDSQKDKQLQET